MQAIKPGQDRRGRRCPGKVLALGAGFLMVFLGNGLRAQDPVEELRKALFIRPDDLINPTDAVLEFRRATLEKRVAALRSIGEMRSALAAWKEKNRLQKFVKQDRVQKLDQEMRIRLGARLKKAVEEAARKPDPNVRLAVASLIGEIGPTIRAIEPGDNAGFARQLTDTVVGLVNDPDPEVRKMALRALGSINADPARAVPVYRKILEQGTEDAEMNRLAAAGLVQMVKVASHLRKKGEDETADVLVSSQELNETCRLVVLASSLGLKSGDAQLRILSLEAIQAAASAYSDLPGAFDVKVLFPPSGRRPLSEQEEKDIRQQYEQVQALIRELAPLLKAIARQGEQLGRCLGHRDASVRFAAVTALEQLSHMRLRLKQRTQSLPKLAKIARPAIDPDFNRMILEQREPVSDLLGAATSDLRTRREAIEFLENLEGDALPVVDALSGRLQDQNKFIRWAAARSLGKLPPAKAKSAVPGLARLLGDNDLDVRMVAAATLERMGPHAKDAVGTLASCLQQGDADFRAAVIYVLASIGPAQAAPAIPGLIKALSADNAPDPRVRRAAAEVLGKFGPIAAAAVPALRDALGDDDAEVRTRAGEALLNILEPVRE